MALLSIKISLMAQFRPPSVEQPYHLSKNIFAVPQKTWIPGLVADPQRNYQYVSPVLLPLSTLDWRMQNNFFWSGTVTTLSFNKGKFGSYFYWDVQGNLRGTRGFIDLSGKNKRGFKLVFPWR
jgi:hypothetical protein